MLVSTCFLSDAVGEADIYLPVGYRQKAEADAKLSDHQFIELSILTSAYVFEAYHRHGYSSIQRSPHLD